MTHTDDRRIAILTVCTISTISTISTVLTVIDCNRLRLREIDSIANNFTSLNNLLNRSHIVVVLQRLEDDLHCRDIIIHLLALLLEFLESIPGRNLNHRTIGKGKEHILIIRGVDTLEERVAIRTICAIRTISAILARSLTKERPAQAIVVRDIPKLILYLKLWRNAVNTICTILTILAIRAIRAILTIFTVLTVLTILAIFTVLTVLAILAVDTDSLNLVASLVQKPFAVQCPVVEAIDILTHTDNRRIAILTICAVLAVSTVYAIFAIFAICAILTVVDADRVRVDKVNLVAHYHTLILDCLNTRDVVIALQRLQDCLHSSDVGVHILTHLLELRNTILEVRNPVHQSRVIIRTAYCDAGRHQNS